jgi:hypothetical protein
MGYPFMKFLEETVAACNGRKLKGVIPGGGRCGAAPDGSRK